MTSYPASFNFILYDVSTLYFETDRDDEDLAGMSGLRKPGYSKDKRSASGGAGTGRERSWAAAHLPALSRQHL